MMDNLEQNIREIVKEVIVSMNLNSTPISVSGNKAGVFSNINEAIDASEKAFKEFIQIPLDIRKNIIENIRKVSLDNIVEMSRMAIEETGLGRCDCQYEFELDTDFGLRQ